MFLFKTDMFFSELKAHAPDVYKAFETSEGIKVVYDAVPSISIDYGIMEKSKRVAVVRLDEKME